MRLKYFGDVLSLLRAAATVPVIVFSMTGNWKAAFVCLGLGWATDLADGPLAKKYGGLRDRYPNFDADGIADSILAFGSTLVPVVYAYTHYDMPVAIGLTLLYALTLVVGGYMASAMNENGHRRLIAFNMIVLHSAVQIGGGLAWFAYMASGTAMAWLTIAVIGLVTTFQREKISLWWSGRFE